MVFRLSGTGTGRYAAAFTSSDTRPIPAAVTPTSRHRKRFADFIAAAETIAEIKSRTGRDAFGGDHLR